LSSEYSPAQIRDAVKAMREEIDGLGRRQRQAA
jgi:hypothetical protein